MLLSEYVMATGDQSVMPGLRRLAIEAAEGQSAVGSWGHGFAIPDGRLGGYGMMNAPGLPLTISLVMAREAGVKDPAVPRAIERSARLLRFYINKGAIPYGDHHPWMKVLLSYGTHAKAVLPELTKIADYFEKDEPDFPPDLMIMKARSVRESIRAIEASKDTPKLIPLKSHELK